MSVEQTLWGALTVRTPGLRTVRRPETDGSPAFDLAYVRTGPRTETPTVVIPGGPGLGSVLPYRGFRRRAARGGLDLIMVEHRGVGLSRRDTRGRDLPVSSMWVTDVVDDIAAVLDHERVRTAVIAGSSYGSYLASGFGVRHGDRVRGMLLDSALQATADIEIERSHLREVLWNGNAVIPSAARRLVERGVGQRGLLDVLRAAYELGGASLVEPLLRQQLAGYRGLAWRALDLYATRGESIVGIPGVYEFDIAGTIGFRELDYGSSPDGEPFDPALTYAPIAARYPAFAGEPFDLPQQTPQFAWPLVVISGSRDLRTPPAIAERVVDSAQDGTLVRIENGHSALDTHPAAMLNAIRLLASGQESRLPRLASTLDRLPRRGFSAHLPDYLRAALRIERIWAPTS